MRMCGILLVCTVLAGLRSFAQGVPADERSFMELEHVSAQGFYLLGMNQKAGFDRVNGVGGGADARFSIDDQFFISIGGAYGKVSLEELDPITKWDWAYWNRLYRNYVVLWLGSDSAYYNGQLVSLRAISNDRLTAGRYTGKDSLYSVELRPMQYLNIYPFTISAGARYRLFDFVTIEGIATATVMPFERNLYLDESWTKRRKVDVGPDSGNYYYFNYGFRNFANPHRGTAFGLGGTIAATADVSNIFSVYATAHYTQFTAAIREESYNVLPMESILLLGAGIRIRY